MNLKYQKMHTNGCLYNLSRSATTNLEQTELPKVFLSVFTQYASMLVNIPCTLWKKCIQEWQIKQLPSAYVLKRCAESFKLFSTIVPATISMLYRWANNCKSSNQWPSKKARSRWSAITPYMRVKKDEWGEQTRYANTCQKIFGKDD